MATKKTAARKGKRQRTLDPSVVAHNPFRPHLLRAPTEVSDSRMYHGSVWNKIPKKVWDKLIEDLREHGIVTDACRQNGIRRETFYRKRREEPEFDDLAEIAHAEGLKRLEDVAVRRATVGDPEAVYFQGEVVGYNNKTSDQLLMFLLQGRDSRYKRKQEITGANGGPLEMLTKMSEAELDADIKRRLAELKETPGS